MSLYSDYWSKPTKMTYQVTEIEFDFEDDNFELPPNQQQEIYEEVLGSLWDAIDGDDLIEEITTAVGFCIKSIDYRIILKG